MSLNLDKSRWTRVRFGDVVRNVNDTVRDLESAGIDRVIALEHMDPSNLSISRWGILEDGTSFSRRVKPGQTLFGKRRAYQRKVAFAEFDAICSGDILTFEADESKMLADFLPFLVQSDAFFDHALGTSAGSLSPRTNWRDLAKFEFDLPSLDQQKRIADLLWTVERHRASVVQLEHAVRRSAQVSISSHLKKGDSTIANYADILVGYAFKSNSFRDNSEAGKNRRLVRGINIGVGHMKWPEKDTVYWGEPMGDRIEGYVLDSGDFVIPMDRPFTADGRLRWAEISDAETGSLLVQRVARLRAKRPADRPLLRALICSNPFQRALNGSLTGSFAPHLAHGDFVSLAFTVKSREAILSSSRTHDVLLSATIEEREALTHLGRSILDKLGGRA